MMMNIFIKIMDFSLCFHVKKIQKEHLTKVEKIKIAWFAMARWEVIQSSFFNGKAKYDLHNFSPLLHPVSVERLFWMMGTLSCFSEAFQAMVDFGWEKSLWCWKQINEMEIFYKIGIIFHRSNILREDYWQYLTLKFKLFFFYCEGKYQSSFLRFMLDLWDFVSENSLSSFVFIDDINVKI